jgi:hypothetical protein
MKKIATSQHGLNILKSRMQNAIFGYSYKRGVEEVTITINSYYLDGLQGLFITFTYEDVSWEYNITVPKFKDKDRSKYLCEVVTYPNINSAQFDAVLDVFSITLEGF